MSVITTYLNHNAQTPLNRFIAGILYNQVCYKYSNKSNRWSLGLSFLASSAVGTQLCIQKMGHVSKTTPLLGVICQTFGKT